MSDKYIEQAPPEPSVELQLRKFTREHRPSQRYSPHEYMIITDRREPEYY